MDDQGWRDFLAVLGDLGIEQRVARLVGLSPDERRSLLASGQAGGLADAFDGGPDDQVLLAALIPSAAQLVDLAACEGLGAILEALAPPERRNLTTQIAAIPAGRLLLADNMRLGDIVRFGGPDVLPSLLGDAAAVDVLAANPDLTRVVANAGDPDEVAATFAGVPALLAGLAQSYALVTLEDALQPHIMRALIERFATDPAVRPLFSERDDAVDLLTTWAGAPADHLASLIADAGTLSGLAGHLPAVLDAVGPAAADRVRRRVLDVGSARRTVAGAASLSATLATIDDDAGRSAFLGALVAHPSSRAALAANTHLGSALETIGDLEQRGHVIGLVERERTLSPQARYTLARARGGERPPAPAVAVAAAHWWGDLVRTTRPEEPQTATRFETLLREAIADALYAPPHQVSFRRDRRIDPWLAEIADAAGFVFSNTWPYQDPRPGDVLTEIAAEVGYTAGRGDLLFPEKTSCRVTWQKATVVTRAGSRTVFAYPQAPAAPNRELG